MTLTKAHIVEAVAEQIGYPRELWGHPIINLENN